MKPKLIVSTEILVENLKKMREAMPNAKLFPVVKGNGYGLGLTEIAQILNHEADGFCVGLESEAIVLAKHPSITKPILLMSPLFDPKHALEFGFIPSIESVEQLKVLDAVGKQNQKELPYHLKLETGLHRFGVQSDQLNQLIDAIKESEWTKLEGVFSHFQNVSNAASTKNQLHEFLNTVHKLESAGLAVPMKHIANGEAAIDYPETRLDLVRIGNALYGKARTRTSLTLKKPERLEVPIVKIQEIPAGQAIGYSGSFKTKKATRIGLIPFGFYDGLNVGRKLSPLKFSALIRELGRITVRYFRPISPVHYQGRPLPMLGREYMQFATIDLTNHPEITVGSMVQVEMSSFFINPGIERIYQ